MRIKRHEGFTYFSSFILKIRIQLILLILNFNNASSQDYISGIVKDKSTGDPIEYALIHQLDKKKVSYTDTNGFFKIEGEVNDTLLIKHISFNQELFKVNSELDDIVILLEPSVLQLNKIIISSKSKRNRIKSIDFLNCLDYSILYALEINPNKPNKKLIGMKVYIGKGGIPTAPFRLMLLERLSTHIDIYNDQVYEVQASKSKSWVKIFFDEAIVLKDTSYIAFERIYNPKYVYKSNDRYCFGVALSLSKNINPDQKVYELFPNRWVDLNLPKHGYNLMLGPIWEENRGAKKRKALK